MTTPSPCDLLITDAVLVPRAARDAVLPDGAVAITGDTITAVGPTAELVRSHAPRRVVSAQGGIVMPGFVNTHNHAPLKIVRGIAPDLGFAPAYIKGIPQGDALSDEDALVLARAGTLELLCRGSTTVVDHYQHAEACAQAAAETGVRALVGGRILDTDVSALARGEWRRDPARAERTIRDTVDLIERWSGFDGGRIQGVVAAHAPDTCSPELLAEVRDLASARGSRLHIHLAQSPLEVERVAARTGLHPVDLLDSLGLLSESLVAAHCIRIGEDHIRRLGAAGVAVAHTPVGNAQGGMTAAAWDLHRAGARVSLCTDSKSADMFEVMRAALWVARIRGAGFAIDAATVLHWATAGGAQALGLGDQVGVIAPGFKADLLVLDPEDLALQPLADPIGVLVHCGSGHQVRHVVVAGRLVVEERAPTRLRRDQVLAEVRRTADRLWRASGFQAGRPRPETTAMEAQA